MRHADQLTGPGAQDRAIDHGHPVERPPGREATCQQLIQLVAAGLDGCRQFVEMPAVDILHPEGLADILGIMLQEHRQELGNRLPGHLPLI